MAELPEVADTGSGTTPRAQLRVLVVDDNVDSSESLAILLQYSGFEVRTCNDPHDVLASIRAFRPHVGLLDIGLPGISGYELAKTIRTSAGCESIALIATTGYGRLEDRELAKAAGFDDFLVKPVDFDTLLQSIRRLTQ